MFEKILNFLGLLDKADMVYENVRETKNEDETKRDYNFTDNEGGFPATKKEAKKVAKKEVKKTIEENER